jgi:hypothetical protein
LVIGQSSTAGTTTVFAKPLAATPAAVICRDMDTVDFMFHWYSRRWEDLMSGAMTGGQSVLVHGLTAAPDPKAYGCVLAPPGTKMTRRGGIIPIVAVDLPGGLSFEGVTNPAMFQAYPYVDPRTASEKGTTDRLPVSPAEPQQTPGEAPTSEKPFTNAVTVAASSAPGAIICGDRGGLMLALSRYRNASKYKNPLPSSCRLISAGTRVQAQVDGESVRIGAPLSGSKMMIGVTLPTMIQMDVPAN